MPSFLIWNPMMSSGLVKPERARVIARDCPKEDGSLISASCICPRGVFNDPQVAIPRVPFSFKAAPRDFHAMDSVFAKKGKVDYTGVGNGVCHFLRVRRNCLQSDD
jgi:hypothetical protein